MRRSYKFLLRPTSRQVDLLTQCLRDHRLLYNAALEERREAWGRSRTRIGFADQSRQMKDIRASDADIRRWSATSEAQTLRKLQRAFDGFFRRVRAGEAPGYPRFKSASRFDSVTWDATDGARWARPDGPRRVYLQGVGHVRVHQHRAITGTPKTITVKREGRRWYVAVSCADVPVEPLPATGRVTGLDLGVKSLLTTSEGVHVGNPEYGRENADELANAQRALARCKRGSKRRQRVRARVAASHRKVTHQRIDYFRKVAIALVRDHDVIVHEALRIGNMSRSARGTVEHPGSQVAQKAGLNRSILDAGWGVFLSILTAKAESAGRELIAVDPRNTSRTCPVCGHVSGDNRVTQAVFRCVHCGHSDHADVVGAVNILRAGLALREVVPATKREVGALRPGVTTGSSEYRSTVGVRDA